VVATKGLDDKAMATWLRANKVDTIQGKLRFNERGNFGDDLGKVKQVQNGKWVVVWPRQWAAPGAKLQTRGVVS
jgi:branched-chain amino acid transport system substrate-binding protein